MLTQKITHKIQIKVQLTGKSRLIQEIVQNCHLLDIKESISSHIHSQLRLVMPGKGKESSSSSSNNNSLDEIKALLNEKFDDFSKKLISVEKKFNTTPERYTSRGKR